MIWFFGGPSLSSILFDFLDKKHQIINFTILGRVLQKYNKKIVLLHTYNLYDVLFTTIVACFYHSYHDLKIINLQISAESGIVIYAN